MINSVLLVAQVILALGLIGLILIQKGKGADAGAAFGGGASGTVFGASGSSNFLSKTTAVFATLFIANSLVLANLASERPPAPESIVEQSVQAQEQAATDAEDLPTLPQADDPLAELPQLGPVEAEPAAEESIDALIEAGEDADPEATDVATVPDDQG